MVLIPKSTWAPPSSSAKSPVVLSSDFDVINSPIKIRVDNQEKVQWNFQLIPGDKKNQRGDRRCVVAIETVKDSHLKFGDYAIVGMEDGFRVERKSKDDMYGTISGVLDHNNEEKRRLKANPKYETSEHWFIDQLTGLNSLSGYGHVIVESTFPGLLIPPAESGLAPKSVTRTIFSWQQRFPMIHWHFPGSRTMCEAFCYQLMLKYFNHRNRDNEGLTK